MIMMEPKGLNRSNVSINDNYIPAWLVKKFNHSPQQMNPFHLRKFPTRISTPHIIFSMMTNLMQWRPFLIKGEDQSKWISMATHLLLLIKTFFLVSQFFGLEDYSRQILIATNLLHKVETTFLVQTVLHILMSKTFEVILSP